MATIIHSGARSARRLVLAGDGCWLLVGEHGLELRVHAQSHSGDGWDIVNAAWDIVNAALSS